MRMNRSSAGLAALVCASLVTACSLGKDATPPPSGTLEENLVSATATVERIDHETRMVTLRRASGDTVTFRADDNVKNLAQVNAGDEVTATYYESIAFEVKRKGDATPGVAMAEGMAVAEPGAMPGATGVQAVTVTSTIEAIDHDTPAVTLRGPQGDLTKIKVRHPEKLEQVSVGDLVEITFSQAVAISVERASQ